MAIDRNRFYVSAFIIALMGGTCLAQTPASRAAPKSQPKPESLSQILGTYNARDTLNAKLEQPEHLAVLSPILWTPADFSVTLEKPDAQMFGENAIVTFPSPLPRVQPPDNTDTVVLEWFMATDEKGFPASVPAVVIIPETAGSRICARTLAAALRAFGVHAFVIQPPGYGRRNAPGLKYDPRQFVQCSRQTVADTRRARDAIRALPGLADQPIHMAGISLGGFLVSVAATLDDGYDKIFIMLAGGNLIDVITHGEKDAAQFKERFVNAGYSPDQLRDELYQVEPLRVANRLKPKNTWLFTGKYDTVVPPRDSDALAATARLQPEHRVVFPTDHYSSSLLLPEVARRIADEIATTSVK